MTDIERLWRFGRIYKAIWEEGQKTRKWLDEHPGHTIILTKKKSDEDDTEEGDEA